VLLCAGALFAVIVWKRRGHLDNTHVPLSTQSDDTEHGNNMDSSFSSFGDGRDRDDKSQLNRNEIYSPIGGLKAGGYDSEDSGYEMKSFT